LLDQDALLALRDPTDAEASKAARLRSMIVADRVLLSALRWLSELHSRSQVAGSFEKFTDAIDRQASVFGDFLPNDTCFLQAPNASAKQLRTFEWP